MGLTSPFTARRIPSAAGRASGSAGDPDRIKLSGVLYVLDEPTIGLHSRDTAKLVRTLGSIRDLGNTVVVVEHDRETMMAADAIEMGPAAGDREGISSSQGPSTRPSGHPS
ncbi:hypothetical protein MASR2M79_12900 [Aminivibrio sp.]